MGSDANKADGHRAARHCRSCFATHTGSYASTLWRITEQDLLQVNTHMELVEKAYNREYHGHVSAIAKVMPIAMALAIVKVNPHLHLINPHN